MLNKKLKIILIESFQNKVFLLPSGLKLLFGDIDILNKIIDYKLHRDVNGNLLMFNKKENRFTKFKVRSVLHGVGYGGFLNYNDLSNENKMNGKEYNPNSLEKFAPAVFKWGFFQEKDFGRRKAGTNIYEKYGPHERTINHNSPYVAFSNKNGYGVYYIGRDKFTGTDQKINRGFIANL